MEDLDILEIKVITSSGKTRISEALEQAYSEWITEMSYYGDIEIHHTLQSETAINSTPHVTLTIFYKIV